MGVLDRLRQTLDSPVDSHDRATADRLRRDVIDHFERERYHKASAAAQELLDLQKKALGERHPEIAEGLINLAMLLEKHADLAEAEARLAEALSIKQEALGPQHPDARSLDRRLAFLRRDRERAPIGSSALPRSPTPTPTPAAASPNGTEPEPTPSLGLDEAHGAPADEDIQEEVSSGELAGEFATLSDAFAELRDRTVSASRMLTTRGAPPPERLIQEMRNRRLEFAALHERARRRARRLRIGDGVLEAAPSLQSLSALLDRIANAEGRQARSEESRTRALGVLDRVLRLAYAGAPPDRALESCQATARSLRQQIAEADWLDMPADAEGLVDGEHPLAGLIALVDGGEGLGDERWMSLYKAVSTAFGPSLAAAVARSRLVATDPAGRAACSP